MLNTSNIYTFKTAMSDLFSFLCLSYAQTLHFALQYIIKHQRNLYSEVIPLTCAAQKHSNVKLMIYVFQMRLRFSVWWDVHCIWTETATKKKLMYNHVIECHHKKWIMVTYIRGVGVSNFPQTIKYSMTISFLQYKSSYIYSSIKTHL